MARTRKYLQWKIAQSAELRWWKNYLKDKDPDDYKTEKLAYWQRVLKPLDSVLTSTEELDILDAGCGPAGVFMALDEARVDAVDPLLEEYHHRLKHFDKGDYPWVRFFESIIEIFLAPITWCCNKRKPSIMGLCLTTYCKLHKNKVDVVV